MHILFDLPREWTKPEPRTDMHEIARHVAEIAEAYSERLRFHAERAERRGLQKNRSAVLLRGAARRADRLAAAMTEAAIDRYDFKPRDWKQWLRQQFAKLGRARERIITAAEGEFLVGNDLEGPELHHLRELETLEAFYAAWFALAFSADAVKFSLRGGDPAAWRRDVAEALAALRGVAE